jgi:hypothetical protein
MPEFIPDKQELIPGDKGGFKQSYEHPTSDQKLILINHKNENSESDLHAYELPAIEVLSPEQIRQYSISRFWLRKILHFVKPDLFPNVHSANDTTFVVGKVEGRKISWMDLSFNQRLYIQEQLAQLGLSVRNVDQKEPNFIVQQSGAITYIDSTMNFDYFAMLLADQAFAAGLEPSEVRKDLINNIEHNFDDVEKPDSKKFQLQEFDPKKIRKSAKDSGLFKKDLARLDRYIQRYEANTTLFPEIDAQNLKVRIKNTLPLIFTERQISRLSEDFLEWIGYFDED